jgi:hypothetical protein
MVNGHHLWMTVFLKVLLVKQRKKGTNSDISTNSVDYNRQKMRARRMLGLIASFASSHKRPEDLG